MKYINNNTGDIYTGGTLTIAHNDSLFSGIPTPEQLTEWGYVEVVEQPTHTAEHFIKVQRMKDIIEELKSMDYLTSKYIDGEDMTEYGDWQETRRQLRVEYRQLEASLELEQEIQIIQVNVNETPDSGTTNEEEVIDEPEPDDEEPDDEEPTD